MWQWCVKAWSFDFAAARLRCSETNLGSSRLEGKAEARGLTFKQGEVTETKTVFIVLRRERLIGFPMREQVIENARQFMRRSGNRRLGSLAGPHAPISRAQSRLGPPHALCGPAQ